LGAIHMLSFTTHKGQIGLIPQSSFQPFRKEPEASPAAQSEYP
jgi:hypothetical protein